MSLDVAMEKARQYLQDAAERVARLVVLGQRMAAAGQPRRRRVRGARQRAVHLNGAAPRRAAQPIAKRNKPVKKLHCARSVCRASRARLWNSPSAGGSGLHQPNPAAALDARQICALM